MNENQIKKAVSLSVLADLDSEAVDLERFEAFKEAVNVSGWTGKAATKRMEKAINKNLEKHGFEMVFRPSYSWFEAIITGGDRPGQGRNGETRIFLGYDSETRELSGDFLDAKNGQHVAGYKRNKSRKNFTDNKGGALDKAARLILEYNKALKALKKFMDTDLDKVHAAGDFNTIQYGIQRGARGAGLSWLPERGNE